MSTCGKCGETYRWKCKSCRNKKLQDQRQNDHTCLDCGCKYDRGRHGKRTRCDSCYGEHRQATTLLHAASQRAKSRGIGFDLDLEWVRGGLRSGCPMTGEKYVIGQGTNYSNRHPLTPSIDKVNPKLGYTKDNCRVVSWFYNMAKQQWSDEEVLELCKKIVQQ